jgi:hypothetical protein
MAAGSVNFLFRCGRNHLILEDEPAYPRFLEEIKSFLTI